MIFLLLPAQQGVYHSSFLPLILWRSVWSKEPAQLTPAVFHQKNFEWVLSYFFSSDFGNHCVWRFIAENYIRNILDECQPSDFVNHWETLSESSDFGNHWKIPFSPSAAAMNSETGKHWREFQIQTYSAADTNHNWGFKLWIFYLNSI